MGLWVAADQAECEAGERDGAGRGGRWAADEGASGAGALPGVCDAQTLFMMGEELRTCMRIDEQCVRENAALLGYLTQGSVRVLTIQSPASSWPASNSPTSNNPASNGSASNQDRRSPTAAREGSDEARSKK